MIWWFPTRDARSNGVSPFLFRGSGLLGRKRRIDSTAWASPENEGFFISVDNKSYLGVK